jgi:hypothetical protein
LVLNGLRASVERRERDILAGKGLDARVREWATKASGVGSSMVFLGSGVVHVTGASSSRATVLSTLLQLPWTKSELRCIEDAIGVLARARWLGLSTSGTEAEAKLRAEMSGGAWRREGPTPEGFARAALRALGLGDNAAKGAVKRAALALAQQRELHAVRLRDAENSLKPEERAAIELMGRPHT